MHDGNKVYDFNDMPQPWRRMAEATVDWCRSRAMQLHADGKLNLGELSDFIAYSIFSGGMICVVECAMLERNEDMAALVKHVRRVRQMNGCPPDATAEEQQRHSDN